MTCEAALDCVSGGVTATKNSAALKDIARRLPRGAAARIEWLPEYRNPHIVHDVFNRVDAVVVPSVWVENSPLVIHEAQQARVPRRECLDHIVILGIRHLQATLGEYVAY